MSTVDTETLFLSDFPVIGREQWILEIEKSLKGQSIDAFRTHPSDPKLAINPFAHIAEEDPSMAALSKGKTDNTWLIGQDIEVTADLQAVNKQLLAALASGVQAPRLHCARPLDKDDWAQVLNGVVLGYISLHLDIPSETDTLDDLLTVSGAGLTGSVQFTGDDPEWSLVCRRYAMDVLPSLRCFTLKAELAKSAIEELTELMKLAHQTLVFADKHDIELSEIRNQIAFEVRIGNDFLLEIAKMRALRHLWANLQAAWQIPNIEPAYLLAQTDESAYGDDAHTNMIRATTHGLSAAIGGANVIFLKPTGSGDDFSNRIARNVQHLLQLESGMTHVSDAAAGSYFIEDLTKRLVETVWIKLQ